MVGLVVAAVVDVFIVAVAVVVFVVVAGVAVAVVVPGGGGCFVVLFRVWRLALRSLEGGANHRTPFILVV